MFAQASRNGAQLCLYEGLRGKPCTMQEATFQIWHLAAAPPLPAAPACTCRQTHNSYRALAFQQDSMK